MKMPRAPHTVIHRVVISPNGREKLELFRSHDGQYGFRVWQRKRKEWRHPEEISHFESYAHALAGAARHINWVPRAFSSQSDSRLNYHLELLRGHRFTFCEYEEEYNGDHDHCYVCWAKIAAYYWPGLLHEGYMTRSDIPIAPGIYQPRWVCKQCFDDLRETLQWKAA